MPDYRKQHFVQRSYLVGFSATGTNIHVFDKRLNKSFVAAIRDVAQEAFFYHLPDGMMDEDDNELTLDPNFVEKWCHAIENVFTSLVPELVHLEDGQIISPETRIDFSRFLAFQYLRTRAFRNVIVDSGKGLVSELLKRTIELNFGKESVKYAPEVHYSDKAAALTQAQQFMDSEKMDELAAILNGHVWTVLQNDTEHPFYTCDNPIVLHNHLARPKFRPGKGFASRGIEIAFPLSSKRLLSLIDRRLLGDAADTYDGKLRIAEPANVEFHNSLQVIESERQLFCETPDWSLAEDMIRESPKLSEPRSRMSVSGYDSAN